jgi:hypothetical protein
MASRDAWRMFDQGGSTSVTLTPNGKVNEEIAKKALAGVAQRLMEYNTISLDGETEPGDDGNDDFNEEVEQLVAESAAVSMPPVQDALVLSEYANPVVAEAVEQVARGLNLADYVWFAEEHFTQVHKWLIALLSAQRRGLPHEFFEKAIIDHYHLDRATRAVVTHRLSTPMRREDVPDSIPDSNGQTYGLQWRDFQWSQDVPARVVDKVAEVVIQTPPDKLEIADYVWSAPESLVPAPTIWEELRDEGVGKLERKTSRALRTKYDPVLYGLFGSWVVEIARWD